MKIDKDKLFARIVEDSEAGFDGNESAGCPAPGWDKPRQVFTAVRQADHRYDGPAPDSQGMTRAEYVGRAALVALNADT